MVNHYTSLSLGFSPWGGSLGDSPTPTFFFGVGGGEVSLLSVDTSASLAVASQVELAEVFAPALPASG